MNHTLVAETQYSIDFTRLGITFCLSLHYNGSNSFLFVIAIYQFKRTDSQIVLWIYPLCLGNISGDFSAINMKKAGLNGYVYDFSIDCRAFDTTILA